ncbi:hypothetical protein GOODEAATRI_016003 [Goodea atripinnis]|uniref:Uncharacterized protein n=1 Tax=Goodea atripinnis TaxID=208336 RepID=A0ABV0PYP2_9TELE
MFLDCGRKPENSERTHACKGRRFCMGIKPRTFLLQGNSVTNCPRVQPNIRPVVPSGLFYVDMSKCVCTVFFSIAVVLHVCCFSESVTRLKSSVQQLACNESRFWPCENTGRDL